MNEKPAGRPRSVKARTAILAAARELLVEQGLTGVTMQGIADRAGVGKPTIYRTWPNAMAVAMSALLAEDDAGAGAGQPARGLSGLRHQLAQLGQAFATPQGRNITMMVAASDDSTELARVFRNHFMLARREEGRAFLQQGIADGMVRPDLNMETALDLLYAPVFYRLLAGHQPLNQMFTDDVLDHLLRGISLK